MQGVNYFREHTIFGLTKGRFGMRMNRMRRQRSARKLQSRKIIVCGLLIVMLLMLVPLINIFKSPVIAEAEEGLAQVVQTYNIDNEHLTLGLRGSELTLVKEGERYIESGAFCIDDRFGEIEDCMITGHVNTDVPGDYTIVYTYRSENAELSTERMVRVVPRDDYISDENGVPVLMYHYVYTEDDVPENLNRNYILDTDLEEQLKYLKTNDYYFPSMSELRAYIDGKISLPNNSVILTFDDAQKNFYQYGYPLLEKYEIPAISFAIGVDADYKIKDRRSAYVAFESHSFDMHREGGNIGHGGRISAMSYEEILEDLKQGIELFASADAFAYPYGDVTDTAQLALKAAGVKCSFTTEYGKVTVGADYTRLPRVRIQGDYSIETFINSLQ